jgi:hypothetical protein
MPEFFTNYSAGIPKQTSLSDMIGNMSALQNYNQNQQLMPIQLEKAQTELQGSKQTVESGGIDLSQKKQANKENLAIQDEIRRNPESFMTNGRFDPNKLMQKLPTLAPMTHTDYIKKYTDAMDNAAKAESSVSKLAEDRRANLATIASSLGYAGIEDPKVYAKAFSEAKKMHPGDDHYHAAADSFSDMFKSSEPGKHLPQTAILMANSIMSPEQQFSAFAEKPGTVNLGDVVQPVGTKQSPLGGAPSMRNIGAPMDLGVPPTTEVVNPATGEKRLVGPTSQRGGQNLQTGMGAAQTSMLGAGAENISKDWTTTTFEAQGAPGRIAIFQNIKKLVPESFTGVGGERKQFLSGLAQAIGIPLNILETSSTDELAKNTKLLQLTGGSTDAARGIAELAGPNTKMTKEGLFRVADQLIGMEKMKEARSRYLQPYSKNAAQYDQEMQKFNQISDSRLFQEMSSEEAGKLWQSLSASEKARLLQMRNQAKQMGVIK